MRMGCSLGKTSSQGNDPSEFVIAGPGPTSRGIVRFDVPWYIPM